MQLQVAVAVAAILSFAVCALAQTAAPAPPAGVATRAKPAERCMRLPLSDVAFGTEGATNAARDKLAEYAGVEARKRKWPASPVTKSAETVSCEVYLNLGPLGTEYRCLVTATFCQK